MHCCARIANRRTKFVKRPDRLRVRPRLGRRGTHKNVTALYSPAGMLPLSSFESRAL